MRRILGIFVLGVCALQLGCTAKEKKQAWPSKDIAAPLPKSCTFKTDLKQIALEWTAFKFSNKTAVKGSFTSVKIAGPDSAATMKDLVLGLSAEIDGTTPDSKDPVRNGNVANSFFKKMASQGLLRAKAVELNGDETQGKLNIEIEMNAQKQTLPFDYNVDANGILTAKAKIDLPQFQLQEQFDSLHKTCEALHTGPDGVSKTWSEVDLQVTAPLKKDCP